METIATSILWNTIFAFCLAALIVGLSFSSILTSRPALRHAFWLILLACSAYCPAGTASPANAIFTVGFKSTVGVSKALTARVEYLKEQGRVGLQAALAGSAAGSQFTNVQGLGGSLGLIPIEDRRQLDSQRDGMLSGFTLGNCLMLVEYTVRLLWNGRSTIEIHF